MRIRYRSPASRYLAAERRADAERAAGIPDRTDEDQRQPWPIVFGACEWTATPRRGYATWRITDTKTGDLIACCTAKGVARLLAKLA